MHSGECFFEMFWNLNVSSLEINIFFFNKYDNICRVTSMGSNEAYKLAEI